jgi:tetratricopeptide (TPR) repeat protein
VTGPVATPPHGARRTGSGGRPVRGPGAAAARSLVLGLLALPLAAAASAAAAQEAPAADPETVVVASRARAAGLLLQIAGLQQAEGLLPEAEESLRRALALEPEPEAAFALGRLLLQRGADDEASTVFASLLDWSGGRAELRVLVGGAYADAGRPGEAIPQFEAAIAADPGLAHAYVSLGVAYLALTAGQSNPEAERALRRALALDPGSYEANYSLGQLELLDGRRREASEHLRAAAAARPGAPDPWLQLGLDAFARGETGEAETTLRKGLALADREPGDSEELLRRACAALARLAFARGDREAAERWFERYRSPGEHDPAAAPEPPATPPDPAEPRRALAERLAAVYNDWGTAEARRGDFAEALVRYRQAERWHPVAPGLARNLGLAAFESGDYAESARALARAVEADPGDRAARALLAISLASSERWAEAAEVFAAIGDAAYADPRLAFLWARSLARSGRPEEARRILARMRELPLPPEALAQVAGLYEEIGDRETAAELEAEAARRRARP